MPKANGVSEIISAGVLNQTVEIVGYHWKLGSRIKADPVQGYQAIRAIYQKHGAVKPEDVVDEARATDSALHDLFEWGDTEAARLYREEQARYVLRSITITYRRPDNTITPPVRAFVKIVPSTDDPALDEAAKDAVQPHVYLPMKQVMEEPDLRQRIRRQAFRELSTWRQRYRDINEFAALFDQIDRLSEQFGKAS